MVNGTQYQRHYAPPAPRAELGKVQDLTVMDWTLLGGGAIVTGAGLTGVVSSLPTKKKKMNWVGLLLSGVITVVGGQAFLTNFRKLIA